MLSFCKKVRDPVWLKSLVKRYCCHKKLALRSVERMSLLECTNFSKDSKLFLSN